MSIRARIWFTVLPLVLVAMFTVAYVALRGSNRHYEAAVETWAQLSECRSGLADLDDRMADVVDAAHMARYRDIERTFARHLNEASRRAADLKNTIQEFSRSFSVAFLLLLLAAGAGSYFIAEHIAVPIAALRQRARAIANGETAAAPPVIAPGDLGELSADIEVMRSHLQRHIEELDDRVARRTSELSERESAFRAVFDSSTAGMVRADMAGHIIDANAAFLSMLRYTDGEMKALTVKDITYPGDWNAEKEAVCELIAGKRAGCNREKRYLRKDGSILWARVSIAVVRTATGNPRFLIGVVTDITDETRQREALQAREHEYRLLFSAMASGFALHEIIRDEVGIPHDYRFLDVNPAFEQLTGMKHADVVGRTARDVYGAAFDEYWVEVYGRVAMSGNPQTFERYDSALKRHFYVTAYCPQHGRFAVLFSDITWRKQAEAEHARLERQMQHSQKLESLGVLTGGIAHDFNNLLMGILGNADIALANLPPDAPGRTELDEIEKASQRAAGLCRQMLAYSGRGKFVVQPLDLSRLVMDLRSMLAISISKTAHLNIKLDPALPAVDGDSTQLQQVVMNLVINASEALSDGVGTITVTTGAMVCERAYLQDAYLHDELPEGLYVYLEVSDTGCGMSASVRERIFEPFFTTKFTGRGLGMAAVLGIVRGHHGTIAIQSQEGQGSTFRILFPASAKAPARGADTAPPTSPALRCSGTILVADDEDTVRLVTRAMLEKSGFTVMTAVNGAEAVQIFESGRDRIAAVILDLTMPVMGGKDALLRIRQIAPDMPAVISSGYDRDETAQRFEGEHRPVFIQKPYNGAGLLSALREAMLTRTGAPG